MRHYINIVRIPVDTSPVISYNVFITIMIGGHTISFPVSTKSTGFGHGLSASYILSAFNAAVANNIRANQQKGYPIARYDADNDQAYLEYPDGTRVFDIPAAECM